MEGKIRYGVWTLTGEGSMDDKKLGRLLRAKKITVAGRGWRCPDETQLAGYVDGRLPAADKNRLDGHLAECDYCLGQVAALFRLEGAAMPDSVPPALLARARDLVPAPAPPSARPVVRWGAIAAVTACIAVVTTVWIHRQENETLAPAPPAIQSPAIPAPASPAAAPPATTPREVRTVKPAGPSLQLLAPREGLALPPEARDFRWTRVPASLYYEVRVMSADGDLVWEGRAEGNQARLPENVQLVSGTKYFVSVRAFLLDGKSLTSPVVRFTAREKN